MNNQQKIEQVAISENRKNKAKLNSENIAVRKLLASAALATAIISWIATAQGLHEYVFDHYWQAAIISGAIQGTLFAFSVNAISLIKKLNSIGKWAMIALWVILLFSSSIFSYVYISKTVYSEKLLMEDANRILVQKCQEMYFALDEILNLQKTDVENQLSEYIKMLGGSESNVTLSEDSKKLIERVIDKIKEFENKNVKEVPVNIMILLEKLKSGTYVSNDVDTLKEVVKVEITEVESLINKFEVEKENIQTDINNINERLETFSNVSSQAYENLLQDLKEKEEKRDEYFEKIQNLNDYKGELENCNNVVNAIENTEEKRLYDEALNLRKYMNEEILNVEEIQKSAENVYNILLENNASASDERLSGYRNFYNHISTYKIVMQSKQKINVEIENLYEYSDDSEKTIEHWRKKLKSLQEISKEVPDEYFDAYSKKYSKNRIIEQTANLDRVYLSDLNDFELAWTLLFNSVHTYKILLIFSLLFAFGIDLFSFGAGCLLYFIKKVEKDAKVGE